MIAVYKVTCLSNGRFYIGSSVNIRKRWSGHKNFLRKGIHDNAHLQRAWDKYGEDQFKFEIVEECSTNVLLEREQFYIDSLNPEFNIAPIAGSVLGYKHTEEVKEHLRQIQTGKNHLPDTVDKIAKALTGQVKSPEHRSKISAAMAGKGARDYRVTNPTGETFMVHNLKKFCTDNGLAVTGMRSVLDKKQASYKGWKCEYD